MLQKYKPRDFYVNRLKPYVKQSLIKVLIGQRRVGKSYVLLQLIDEIKQIYAINDKQILYINKELFEFDHIKNHKDLIEYIQKTFPKNKKHKFVFIDEVQEIENFHLALRSLNATGDYDIYITGSNADLLSSDIANYLGGRYISLEIQGLSYSEFLQFHNLKSSRSSLLRYIELGSLPYLMHIKHDEVAIRDYQLSIYNTVLLKDIVRRYEVRNVDFLERLVLYLGDNIGSPFSAKSISDYLKAERTKLSSAIISKYLKYLDSTFLLYQVPRSLINGKKVFQRNEKYYFNDFGIRNALLGYKADDISKAIENIVYLHLRRQGYKVQVGSFHDGTKIDFVAQRNDTKLYLQATYMMENSKVFDREFGNLLKIEDNYPKIVVSLDDMRGEDYKGIKHINLEKFLLSESSTFD